MLLVIDAGNTNLVFALYDGQKQMGQWRCKTDHQRTADEYFVWLSQLVVLEGFRTTDITAVAVGSVVPAANFALRKLSEKFFKTKPVFYGDEDVKVGVEVKIDRPSEAGADRVINALEAHKTYGGPLVIVDFGTATTFDVVDDDGAYRGGMISPGIAPALEGLYISGARLPNVAISKPEKVIGTNTVGAIQSGIFWGYIGLIEGSLRRIEVEAKEQKFFAKKSRMKVIATGGIAPLFDEVTDVFDEVDPDLTLRGLVRIYTQNS